MSLIIDKQCVYKTIDVAREKEKQEQLPKKYLKLTCPLALLSEKKKIMMKELSLYLRMKYLVILIIFFQVKKI